MTAYDALKDSFLPGKGGAVYGLLTDMSLAVRITQSAKHCNLTAQHHDRAARLLEQVLQKKPRLIIIDWDHCEAEGFKFLNELNKNADLKQVPVIGTMTSSNTVLQQEARRAGCIKVYGKTEFKKELDPLLARYS